MSDAWLPVWEEKIFVTEKKDNDLEKNMRPSSTLSKTSEEKGNKEVNKNYHW